MVSQTKIDILEIVHDEEGEAQLLFVSTRTHTINAHFRKYRAKVSTNDIALNVITDQLQAWKQSALWTLILSSSLSVKENYFLQLLPLQVQRFIHLTAAWYKLDI